MPNTIVLKGPFVQKEGIASSTITPGMLVEFGGSNDLQPHSTVGGVARRAFAIENDLEGGGITDNYLVNVTVKYGVFTPGAEVYGILSSAATCTQGQGLESDGHGKLVPVSSPAYQHGIVAWALETQAVAGGRVKVEVN